MEWRGLYLFVYKSSYLLNTNHISAKVWGSYRCSRVIFLTFGRYWFVMDIDCVAFTSFRTWLVS
jgi:hypothetical protein